MIAVTFAGRTFSDPPTGSDALLGLGGWFDGAPVRGQDTPRPQGHGSFGERAWRAARLVTVTVAVRAGSTVEASQAQQWCSAALGDGRLGTLEVRDPAGMVTSADVRLGGAPLVQWYPDSSAVRAQFQFLAPDPLRYAALRSAETTFPEQAGGLEYPLYTDGDGTVTGWLDYGEPSSTGRVVLDNPGTADTWPQFEVAGPVPSDGFEILTVGTGRRLRFEGAVPAGSLLVLDAATGSVVIDGVADRGGLLTWRDWSPVPAGGSSEFAFIPLGSASAATLRASIRPAYW